MNASQEPAELLCNVCERPLGEPLYVSAGKTSITTMLETTPERTRVRFCDHCGHLRTETLVELGEYYDKQYKILVDSDEEDQLYEVRDGEQVFRLRHQADTLLKKIVPPPGARMLDYGCAKGATLKHVRAARPDVDVHLFDVSDSYVPFWRKFVEPDRWAAYSPRAEWAGRFDVVASFFALEHVLAPREMLATVASLLRPDGLFYCIVPNVYANVADFVVADHVNHFSAESLRMAFASAGLEMIDVDATCHHSAWVATARNVGRPVDLPPPADHVSALRARSEEMAEFWRRFGERVRRFEADRSGEPAAIYGAGFYGNFVATCLDDLSAVRCFVDRDPFRQGKRLWDRPIVAPELLPADVHRIFVGLNPARARDEMRKVDAWRDRPLTFHFLDS